jgi:diguanylate cyclase (GGDEF)-like protein
MNPPRNRRSTIERCEWFVAAAAWFAMAVGILVLLGWIFGIDLLKRGLPGLVSMNPATAVAFILAGFSLWLQRRPPGAPRAGTTAVAARVAAGAVLAIGILRVAGYAGGWDGGMASRAGDPQVLTALREIGARTAGIDDPDRMSSGMRVLRTGESVIVPDLMESSLVPDWVRDRLRQAGVHAQALLPVGDPPGCVFGLYAGTPQAFDAEEVALFERIASEIDYAIDFIGKGEQLEYLAYNNPVSGLSNRAALHMQLRPWLQREPLVLVLLDIERFAAINESRGRGFGDALLRETGQRLRGLVGAAGLVAHVEADTFALAYRASGDSIEAETERLEHLLREFGSEPFRIGDEEIRIDMHAGMAIGPDHGEDVETLEHSAAAALTEGDRRKVRLYAFTDELRGRAARRLGLEHELRLAIEHEQFELYYQPKFTADNQQLCGAEALLRWRHPERGLVSPGEFIPVLEDSELIVQVGRWVMREALRAALAWREHHPGLRIAINVSTRELRHSRFLDECRDLLQPHASDQPLDIEITESLLMDDIAHSRQLLDALRDFGCRIAIDDFGTGYSSLSYLARLPIDELKIDLSFIAVIAQSPETMALVTNIISLAHSLGMKVVAEGVEEEEQAKLLRLLRCDVLQGYLLGRPQPAAEFETRLQGAAPR